MKRFWKDLKSHYRYAIYSAKFRIKIRGCQFLPELDLVGVRTILLYADLCVYFWRCV